eukprot:SAG11_NODE_12152_length_719_cov_1.409677_1_plen_62_part_10
MARAVKAAGAKLVGIFPFEREDGRESASAEARSLCDHSFDNLSGDVHGVVELAGYPTKMIPT